MSKVKNQVKSHFYYIFWGLMSVAVVGTQLYNTTKYDRMTTALESAIYAIENDRLNGKVPVSNRGVRLGPGY